MRRGCAECDNGLIFKFPNFQIELQVGVVLLLVGEGGGIAVSRVDVGIVRENGQFAERADKHSHVATRQVGSANGLLKERVACEKHVQVGQIVADRVLFVPWSGYDKHLQIRQLWYLQFAFGGRDGSREAVGLLHERYAAHVVGVRMGNEQCDRRQAMRRDELGEALLLAVGGHACINDKGAPLLVVQQVRALAVCVEVKDFQFHGETLISR